VRVLVAGEESAGAQALRITLDRGHEVVGALTAGAATAGSVAGVATGAAVPVLDPGLVTDAGFARWVADHDVDLLLNVHSLRIAHAAVVAAPRLGSFNLHPGPLPRYAGLNAPSWAIYEGETRHAVTLHRMEAEVDAGTIAYEAWFDIGPHDTGLRVATTCVRLGVPLVGRLLDAAAEGPDAVPAHPQAATGRRWFGRAAPDGGRLPWARPVRRVADHVRAADYAPFPSPWGWPVTTTADGRELEVVRVGATSTPCAGVAPGTVGRRSAAGVEVACADAWAVVERVRCDGRAVPADEVLRPGTVLTDPAS
jgi:UDP-4-amino-4-deoxy-L-arabinose formyltransferase/UDP-glucuronic acid dehydrogenase (UDP-4-keto-hexauronic acid decarboxylating)